MFNFHSGYAEEGLNYKTNQLVLDIDPQYNSYDFYLTLARDAAEHKQPDMSIEYYEKAIEANPKSRNQLIREYAKQLSYANYADEAIVLYKELLNTGLSAEDKRLTHRDLAELYVRTEQFPLALAEYEDLIVEDPQDCQTRGDFANLTISFARNDAGNLNHTAAQNWYLNAMLLDPRTKESILREYVDEVSRGGLGSEAIDLYKEILFTCASPAETRLTNLGLAQAYILVNNYDEALKIYDVLFKINPRDKEAKKGKVKIYVDYARFDAGKGDHSQAIKWFKKAIEVDPDEKPKLIKELADELKYNSQIDEAIVLYKEILDGKPGGDYERKVRLSLAGAYRAKFAYDDALKEYNYLLEQNKYDGVAKQGKAKIYLDFASYNAGLGKHREAIEWYYKAIANDPIIRPEILFKIEDERAILGDKDIPPISEEERALEACLGNDQSKAENVLLSPTPPPTQKDELGVKPAILPGAIEILKETPATETPSAVEMPKQTPGVGKSSEERECISLSSDKNNQSDEVSSEKDNKAKDLAKKAFENAQEYAKHLQVFEANRAFEVSLTLDPENQNYREHYAWHLQAFSFIPEAIDQFYILLPNESDKTFFYQVLGWDNHTLGQLNDSIWAFSHIYDIPCYLTLSNKFIFIKKLYNSEYYTKINKLRSSLVFTDKKSAYEIKKKLFESYVYLGDLEEVTSLALEILREHSEEYMVQYHYATLLHQKKNHVKAAIQFQLLLDKLPCNAFLYLMLGKVYEDMGYNCSAQIAYQNALSLDRNSRTERAYARILSKLCDCSDAFKLSDQIVVDESGMLGKILSSAEVSLNCGSYEDAACMYRGVLCEYPYNQEALWGLLKSSTYTGNFHDALLSYTRWQVVWFDDPLQNQLVSYYRPAEIILPVEFFHDSTPFRRASIGFTLNEYVCKDIRLYAKAYYTQFGQKYYNTIDRQSIYLGFDKLFNKTWEFKAGFIENYYDNNLQHRSKTPPVNGQKLYSKAVGNYRLHLIYHELPVFTVDLGYEYYDVIDTVPPFNNPIYNYSNQIGATAFNLKTADWNLFLNYSKEKIYWYANFVRGNYSDGNVKQTRSFRVGYRFSDLPSSSVYYGYFYLNFNRPAPIFSQNGHSTSAYYDPKNFELHLIGTDSKYDVTRALQVGGELALSYLPKCKNFGYTGYGYFSYRFTDRWSCRLDLRYYYQTRGISRTGILGYYHAESGNFQINYEF